MSPVLENGTKATALLSFAVLMLTVFHDWGYYWIVGPKFQSLQTTYDYIANSITWLPLSLTILLIYAFCAGQLMSFAARRSSGANHLRKGVRKAGRRLTAIMKASTAIAALLSGALAFFTEPPISTAFGTAFALSLYVLAFAYFAMQPWKYGEFALPVELAAALPGVLMLSFAIGNVEAIVALTDGTSVYALQDKDGNKRSVIALRSLDKGVLTYDRGAHRIAFVRWDSLTGVERPFYVGKQRFCILNGGCDAPSP